MKRKVVLTLALLIAITTLTGALWAAKRVQAVNVLFNVNDLPEYGIRIIAPTDSSFDDMVSEHNKGRIDSTEAPKPFSVFIKNSGARAVIAYKVKWELLRSDGRVLTHTESYAEPGLFMGRKLNKNTLQDEGSGYVIRPNTAKLISWVTSMAQSDGSGFAQGTSGGEALNQLNAQLLRATSLTVSVDGAFLEDGTFVGLNTTGYFEQIEAQIRARRDLLESLVGARQNHGKLNDAFSSVEEMSNNEDVRINYDSTPADFYKHYRKLFAKELAGIKGAYGKEKALEYALELHGKSWLKLKKH